MYELIVRNGKITRHVNFAALSAALEELYRAAANFENYEKDHGVVINRIETVGKKFYPNEISRVSWESGDYMAVLPV
jgi:hypothetical protein